MISKRKLLKYRKEALVYKESIKNNQVNYFAMLQTDRLLELTQELIDQQLLKENKKNERMD